MRDLSETVPAMGPADEAVAEQVIALLPDVGKLLYAAIARHARATGLSLPQIKTLYYLFHRAPCAVRDVADGMGISMATASEMLDRLVELRLIARMTDPVDRRRVIVELTPDAQRLLAEVAEIRRCQVRAALARLEPAARPVFLRGLQALVAALGEEIGPLTCAALVEQTPADTDAPASPDAVR